MREMGPQTGRVASSESGFTLVEVMVALMIVAIALPALMFQIGSQLDGREHVRDQLIASWVAQEQLSRLKLRFAANAGAGAAPATQGQTELAGRQWHWQHTIEATPAPGLFRHSIRVALSANQALTTENALFSLDAYLATGPLSANLGMQP